MIFSPTLPPRAGYTEVVDENGNHVYKPTAATLAIQKNARQEIIATDAMIADGSVHLILPRMVDDATLVKFRAPCDCAEVTGGIVIDGITYTVVDAMGERVPGNGGAWRSGAMVAVVIDVKNTKAYIQNAAAHPPITASGILKGDGSGGVTAAKAGTDYVLPSGNITGNAATATTAVTATTATTATKANQLTTARTVRTNLGSTSAANFDGTANITPRRNRHATCW